MHNKTKHLIGLDIQENFINLVELSYIDSKCKVETCAQLVLPEPMVPGEHKLNAIRNLIEQAVLRTNRVAVALPHTAVMFKEVQVAINLSPKEIKEFLRFKLMEDNQELEVDFAYQSLGVVTEDSELNKLQVVAVKQEHTKSLVKLLSTVNLVPKIIDVDIYALERAIRWQLKNLAGLTAVINCDFNQVLIVVLDSKQIVYWDEDMISEIPLLELLELKLQVIQKTFVEPLDQLVLGGVQATFPGLAAAISDRFKLPVIIADPFLGMEVSDTIDLKIAPLMLISCGLALRVNDYR